MAFYNNNLPVEYVLEKFYTFSGKPVKVGNKYNASCPICREGKHWLKKKRLYFYPNTNSFFCHNCQESWSALWWIHLVTRMECKDIVKEAIASYGSDDSCFLHKVQDYETKFSQPDIPEDSIDLLEPNTLEFYKDNKKIQAAADYIVQRRLNTAINAPKSLYYSASDFIHKNRIIIPFYDSEGRKILFYQTRKICEKVDSPKYLSKSDSEKTVFNIDKIIPEIPYIFIFEGPIDSCFVKNGVSIAGINYTNAQSKQLESLDNFYKKIWILDNPHQDNNDEVNNKLLSLIDRNETVFIWPKELDQYKDINELCSKKHMDEIPYELFLKFAKSGNEAKIAFALSR
jgi:hypothetical protein